jgi:hypothetical protein
VCHSSFRDQIMHPSISAPLLVVVCSFFTVATSPSLRRRAGGAFSPGRVIRRVEIDADARPSRAPPTQPLVSACFLVRLPSSTPDRRRFQFHRSHLDSRRSPIAHILAAVTATTTKTRTGCLASSLEMLFQVGCRIYSSHAPTMLARSRPYFPF